MKSKRKFYKTLITLEVLSEEPIPDGMELESIIEEATTGGYSMEILKQNSVVIGGQAMAKRLIAQASSPEFFKLNEKGEDI